MSSPIIVVGHRNPDNDSICAAVGYAYLKNELARRAAHGGEPAQVYVPARLGPLPPESAQVLSDNGLPVPEIIGHVHARVADVMTPDPISIEHDATLLEAGRLLRQCNVRSLVVTNDDGTYRGLITTRMIAERYICPPTCWTKAARTAWPWPPTSSSRSARRLPTSPRPTCWCWTRRVCSPTPWRT